MKKLFIPLATLASLVISLLMPAVAHADAVTLSLTSSAANVKKGSMFKITLRVNTSGQVTDVKARISYNPSQFSLTQYIDSGVLSGEGPEKSSGTGFYTVHQMKLGGPYPSGSFAVGQLEFTALADSGTGTFAISGNANDTSVGNANDPDGGAHTPQTVQGVSVALEPVSEGSNPGTVTVPNAALGITKFSEGSKTANASDTSQNAGTAVTDTSLLAKAETDNKEAAKAVTASISAGTSKNAGLSTKKFPFVTTAVLAAVLVLAAGFWIIRSKADTNLAPANTSDTSGPVVGDMSMKVVEPEQPKDGDKPKL